MFERIDIAKGSLWCVHAPLIGTDRTLRLNLEGEWDDTFSLEKVWSYLAKIERDFDQVQIDVGSVTRVNSQAVVEWMKFIEKIQSRHKVSYALVSEAMLELTAMIKNFLGRSPILIREFFAAFFCAACRERHRIRVTLQGISPQDSVHLVGARPCPACSKQMHYDESLESLDVVLQALSPDFNQMDATVPQKSK